MKIGQFITVFPSWEANEKIYGSTRAAYDLSLNLAKGDNEVSIFSTSNNSYDVIEHNKNMTIHRYGSLLKLYSTRISTGIFTKPIVDKPDIVHVHFDIPPTPFAGLRVAKKIKKPLVVTYHGDWDSTYGSIVRKLLIIFFNKCFVDKLLKSADLIICPSAKYIAESKFIEKYSEKVRVIPNGVNREQFTQTPSKKECRKVLNFPINHKIILFLGALDFRKGPDILLNSMVSILEQIPESKLVFVGDGNYKTELQVMAQKLKLDSHVDFVGYIDEELKSYYYKASDAFVIPSTISTDVFPLVILEAMASGTPVIASNLETFKYIIKDGENGVISEKGNSSDLACKIITILIDDSFRDKIIENGIRYVDTHSWEQISKETELLYNELLSNKS